MGMLALSSAFNFVTVSNLTVVPSPGARALLLFLYGNIKRAGRGVKELLVVAAHLEGGAKDSRSVVPCRCSSPG